MYLQLRYLGVYRQWRGKAVALPSHETTQITKPIKCAALNAVICYYFLIVAKADLTDVHFLGFFEVFKFRIHYSDIVGFTTCGESTGRGQVDKNHGVWTYPRYCWLWLVGHSLLSGLLGSPPLTCSGATHTIHIQLPPSLLVPLISLLSYSSISLSLILSLTFYIHPPSLLRHFLSSLSHN